MQIGRITFGPTKSPAEVAEWRKALGRVGYSSAAVVDLSAHGCNCIGPQAGEKKCPCVLRGEIEQGRRMVRDGVVIDGVEYDLVPKCR